MNICVEISLLHLQYNLSIHVGGEASICSLLAWVKPTNCLPYHRSYLIFIIGSYVVTRWVQLHSLGSLGEHFYPSQKDMKWRW